GKVRPAYSNKGPFLGQRLTPAGSLSFTSAAVVGRRKESRNSRLHDGTTAQVARKATSATTPRMKARTTAASLTQRTGLDAGGLFRFAARECANEHRSP